MRELWILIISAITAHFWTAELWRGNVWGAALVMTLGLVVMVGGLLALRFKEVLWQRLVK